MRWIRLHPYTGAVSLSLKVLQRIPRFSSHHLTLAVCRCARSLFRIFAATFEHRLSLKTPRAWDDPARVAQLGVP